MADHDEKFCKERAAAMRALAGQAVSRTLRRDYLAMSREWMRIAQSAEETDGARLTQRNHPWCDQAPFRAPDQA
jgi:hypothetical protein